jgi:hypothetical protein
MVIALEFALQDIERCTSEVLRKTQLLYSYPTSTPCLLDPAVYAAGEDRSKKESEEDGNGSKGNRSSGIFILGMRGLAIFYRDRLELLQ